VRIDDMRQAYWDRRFNGARRVQDADKNKRVHWIRAPCLGQRPL